ncbi:hypothetical protein V8C26DRAFT_95617 [Trichoderma gracile]
MWGIVSTDGVRKKAESGGEFSSVRAAWGSADIPHVCKLQADGSPRRSQSSRSTTLPRPGGKTSSHHARLNLHQGCSHPSVQFIIKGHTTSVQFSLHVPVCSLSYGFSHKGPSNKAALSNMLKSTPGQVTAIRRQSLSAEPVASLQKGAWERHHHGVPSCLLSPAIGFWPLGSSLLVPHLWGYDFTCIIHRDMHVSIVFHKRIEKLRMD